MTGTIIKAVNGKHPHWGDHCHFAENATIVGDISMGDDCSVWYGAVLRADVDRIIIGDRCNIQDLACIHQTAGRPAILGNDVSLGHGAVVHAATIHDGALIGMNAVVLDLAEVGEGSIVAAGAVVLEKTVIGPGELWAGVPARFVKKIDPDKALSYARHYCQYKQSLSPAPTEEVWNKPDASTSPVNKLYRRG